MNQEIAYAETLDDVNKSIKMLNLGSNIIMGFVVLGLALTIAGWALDVGQKQKIKIYMETSVYLLAILVVAALLVAVIIQLKTVTTMGM